MRGTIVVDENRCKGCELCIVVCPKGIITLAKHFTPHGYHPARLVDPILVAPGGDCTGCLLCSTICPDAAITVYRQAKLKRTPAGAN
jgi:2-oxoglutarate ferredoxin oxidoreductase subunit delta